MFVCVRVWAYAEESTVRSNCVCVCPCTQERAALSRLRTDLEKAATRLEAERSAWERRQASESSTFETWRAAEMARLERDRRVLDKQSKAILKVGTSWAHIPSHIHIHTRTHLRRYQHAEWPFACSRKPNQLCPDVYLCVCVCVCVCARTQLPTKKERSAVEAVEAVLEEERREARATAARHKLTVERLRRQLLDQQVCVHLD